MPSRCIDVRWPSSRGHWDPIILKPSFVGTTLRRCSVAKAARWNPMDWIRMHRPSEENPQSPIIHHPHTDLAFTLI
jgi:hypothetical protein